MSNNSDLGAFLGGVLVGGVLGLVGALFLAPQSGQETREQLIGKGVDLRDSGVSRAEQVSQQATQYAQTYRDRATDLTSGAKERVQGAGQQMQEQARIILDTGKRRASQVLPNRNASEDGETAV